MHTFTLHLGPSAWTILQSLQDQLILMWRLDTPMPILPAQASWKTKGDWAEPDSHHSQPTSCSPVSKLLFPPVPELLQFCRFEGSTLYIEDLLDIHSHPPLDLHVHSSENILTKRVTCFLSLSFASVAKHQGKDVRRTWSNLKLDS